MIRTIHFYIWRELAKATLLALVAFTLLLTVVGIIEPLRKQQGLGAEQVLALFGYLLPAMLSLTLPVGAMFAATVVYGRFAQDNEHLACRASGISTMNLLRPAMVLGLIVTACSLILSNFVAPHMVAGTKIIEKNAREAAYRQLRSRSYLEISSSRWVHADWVDEQRDILHGVVHVDVRSTGKRDPTKPEDLRIIVAQSAVVNLSQKGDDLYIQAKGTRPAVLRTGAQVQITEDDQEVMIAMPNQLKERAAMMDWNRMIESLYNPYSNSGIEKRLMNIRLNILHDNLAREVWTAINDRKPYSSLVREQALLDMKTVREKYVISAAGAKLVTAQDSRRDRYSVELTGTVDRPVRVDVFRNDVLEQTYTSLSGSVAATSSAMTGDSQVNLSLYGPVTRTSPADPHPERRGNFEVGQLPIPQSVMDSVAPLNPENLYGWGLKYAQKESVADFPDGPTKNPQIFTAIRNVAMKEVRSILKEIEAEIHCRAAFSLSCFLMVSLGAALGLLSRGGQVIVAFAVGALPGIAVMILIFSGRNMIENTKIAAGLWGMAMIWGGVALLLVSTVLVYARLTRR